MNLYWVTTNCGCENWFIVAGTKKAAERLHEDFEGFGRTEAKAKLVCPIPKNLAAKHRAYGWPSHELLNELGGEFVSIETPRIINLNGKVFKEGYFIESSLIGNLNSPGVYLIQIQGSNKYKIGRTKNIGQRLQQIQSCNPDHLKLLFFVTTKHYVSLEKHLLDIYSKQSCSGEWFILNNDLIGELELRLEYLNHHPDFTLTSFKRVEESVFA